jgi:hypothetical protein
MNVCGLVVSLINFFISYQLSDFDIEYRKVKSVNGLNI